MPSSDALTLTLLFSFIPSSPFLPESVSQSFLRLSIHLLSLIQQCVDAQLLQSCLTLGGSKDCNPPGFSVHDILQARILAWIACVPPGDLPDSGIKPTSALQVDSLTAEPLGKASNHVYLSNRQFPPRGMKLTLVYSE